MDGCCRLLFLLSLSAVTELIVIGKVEGYDPQLVKNLTDKGLQVIPLNQNNSHVYMLVIEGNQISLNEMDQKALTSYPTLVELRLGGNLVTTVSAKYFSGLSHLRVLSLARNSLNSVDPEAFSGLDTLEELDLSSNKLTTFPAQIFTELKSLKILHLRENPWNCSCPLLNTIGRMNEANVTIGGPNFTCVSPAEQKGRPVQGSISLCSKSSPATVLTDHISPTPPVTSQQPETLSNMLTATLASRNRTVIKDKKPVLGNTWKFTACVAALALTTCTLILTAIKGPSWYKRFHNYRHRRLDEDDKEEGQETMSTETGGYESQQTFTFEELSHQIQEQDEEDGYFEDPYIKGADDAEEEIPGGTEAHQGADICYGILS